MADRVTPRRRGSYGIDAPYAPAFLTGLAALYLVLAVTSGRLMYVPALAVIAAVDAAYLYTTLRGKFVVWAELLDRLKLRGDERILDLGCGRGAVLLLAAQVNNFASSFMCASSRALSWPRLSSARPWCERLW